MSDDSLRALVREVRLIRLALERISPPPKKPKREPPSPRFVTSRHW